VEIIGMKKLALVYDAVYPFIKGGGEKRFYDIGLRLSKDYDVHFYGMKLWKGKKVKEIDGMTYHGISKAISLYDNEKRTIGQAIKFGFSAFKLLKEDFDIIDCCGFPYFSLFPAKLACIIKGKPLYSTWHEVWGKKYWREYLGWKGIFGYWIEKLSSKLPNKIIAISEHTKDKLINQLKVPKEKIIIIPNAIDIKEIDKIKPSKEKSDIIFAGRLISHKNVNILIKAIEIIQKQDKNIKCIIVGDGPEMNNLKTLAKTLNLTKNIIFKGFVKENKEVISLMKSSNVFVLTSTREGFGFVVIEANACGIPVITVNHKDNASKDLIQNNKNGFVCKLDEKSISENILKALNKRDWKTKEYVKKYDWDNIIKMFKEVYE
jgi:glycosyltransferase involved in cell wall biosynthesis